MQEALRLARLAWDEGEVPVGAVIVRDGEIIASGYNKKEGSRDATMHAEIVALREAYKALNDWRLDGCTVYVTLEPCAMCAGAIIASRPDALIFGAYDKEAGCCGSVFDLICSSLSDIKLAGGFMEEECSALLEGFFREKRASSVK